MEQYVLLLAIYSTKMGTRKRTVCLRVSRVQKFLIKKIVVGHSA